MPVRIGNFFVVLFCIDTDNRNMESATTQNKLKPPNDPRLLTLTEYAHRHHVTRNTVFNWMRNDNMPDDVVHAYRLPGGHWRIEIENAA